MLFFIHIGHTFHPYFFVFFFCFPNIIIYILNIDIAIRLLTVNELKDFIFENYYRQMGVAKENNYYSMKRQKKDLQLFATKLTEKNT